MTDECHTLKPGGLLGLDQEKETHGFLRTKFSQKICFHKSFLVMCRPLAGFTKLPFLCNGLNFLVTLEQIFWGLHIAG